MGDSAYSSADTIEELTAAGFTPVTKVRPAKGRGGRFGKDAFTINLNDDTVTCPAAHTVAIRRSADGGGRADFAAHCAACPLRAQCTTATGGRSIAIHPKEHVLQHAKQRQAQPGWRENYRATRPKVERKIAHFVAVRWGGRNARFRGTQRVTTDVVTRAAAVNWNRLVTLGIAFTDGQWATTTS